VFSAAGFLVVLFFASLDFVIRTQSFEHVIPHLFTGFDSGWPDVHHVLLPKGFEAERRLSYLRRPND
jgi:hypothetical protein